MAKVGRPPAIEKHPRRAEILEALLQPGANFSAISREFKISDETLATFRRKHITPAMQAALDRTALSAQVVTSQMDVLARLDGLVAKAEKMLAAADAWLEDPDAPGRYNLNPRSHEVDVIYEREIVGANGTRTQRRTEKLGKLMADVEAGLGITVVRGETKTADPRKLLLEAVATLKPVVELIGKATGQIRPDPPSQVNVLVTSPDWLAMRERIVSALEAHPEALAAVQEAFGAR